MKMGARLSVPAARVRKVARGDSPLVMVTAYDAPSARMVDAAGVDIVLVGDSVAMAVLGYEDTLHVTVDDLAHHTAAVVRARPGSLVVADLPWLSYHVGPHDAVRNAARLVRAGAEAVKLEGGRQRVEVIEAIVAAEIPVMGHLGLTPQSIHALGGFKVQGREADAVRALVADAEALVAAGVFGIVLECVPAPVAGLITEAVPVPTIGIGAGPDCDGQVLVFHDVVGLEDRSMPRFVRSYAELARLGTQALEAFAADVRHGRFPAPEEAYVLSEAVAAELGITTGGSPEIAVTPPG